jgi:hypothetical protein
MWVAKQVADLAIVALPKAGIEIEEVERGLDYGVWPGFLCGKLVSHPARQIVILTRSSL